MKPGPKKRMITPVEKMIMGTTFKATCRIELDYDEFVSMTRPELIQRCNDEGWDSHIFIRRKYGDPEFTTWVGLDRLMIEATGLDIVKMVNQSFEEALQQRPAQPSIEIRDIGSDTLTRA